MFAFLPYCAISHPWRRRLRTRPSLCTTHASSAAPSAPPPSTPPPTSALSSLPSLIPISSDQWCGFAGLIGPSNSGKSTLLNRLVGQKVAIVTPKVQTTRCRISAIATYDKTQVIYLDTPGIFTAGGSRLGRAMVKAAWKSGAQSDAIGVIIDVSRMYYDGKRAGVRKLRVSEEVLQVLKGVGGKRGGEGGEEVVVCGNKMDEVPKEDWEFVREKLGIVMGSCGMGDGTKCVLMSAKDGDGVEEFAEWVVGKMPSGNWLYGEDELTDMPMRLMAAEVTREKLFMMLREELPYEMAVETVGWKEGVVNGVLVEQNILVGRESQKGMVVGAGGSMIKKIGIESRKEMEEFMGGRVHLKLKVKVRPKWKEDRKHYQQWGLDYNA